MSVNQTALRILSLLTWLQEAPHGVKDFNRRLMASGLTECPLSEDTLLLYINTLRQLGCRIRRPSPQTGFCYQLLDHRFKCEITEQEVLALAQARLMIEPYTHYRELFVLDRLLRKVLGWFVSPIKHFWDEIPDYAPFKDLINRLEAAILNEIPLQISYATHGTLALLPDSLTYHRGCLFLRGFQPDYTDLSMLRLEKILTVEFAPHLTRIFHRNVRVGSI
jgi:hypothetical protein